MFLTIIKNLTSRHISVGSGGHDGPRGVQTADSNPPFHPGEHSTRRARPWWEPSPGYVQPPGPEGPLSSPSTGLHPSGPSEPGHLPKAPPPATGTLGSCENIPSSTGLYPLLRRHQNVKGAEGNKDRRYEAECSPAGTDRCPGSKASPAACPSHSLRKPVAHIPLFSVIIYSDREASFHSMK